MEWYYWIVIFFIVVGSYSHYTTKWRRERLMKKYGNSVLVEKLMSKNFWQGQAASQLIDSIGKPLDIDQKVLKTKTKEVWKYNKTGKNRYALKITLENGEVVGWDKKGDFIRSPTCFLCVYKQYRVFAIFPPELLLSAV